MFTPCLSKSCIGSAVCMQWPIILSIQPYGVVNLQSLNFTSAPSLAALHFVSSDDRLPSSLLLRRLSQTWPTTHLYSMCALVAPQVSYGPSCAVTLHDAEEDRHRRSWRRRSDSEDGKWDLAFVDHKSAQLFALWLLQLPWKYDNYVVGGTRDKKSVRNMPTRAKSSSNRFLLRLRTVRSALHLGRSQLAEVLAATEKPMQHRQDVTHLCELDDVLASVQHPVSEVPLLVGVLLINVEYCELTYQPIRHVSANTLNLQDTEVTLEVVICHVVVARAFGVKHVLLSTWIVWCCNTCPIISGTGGEVSGSNWPLHMCPFSGQHSRLIQEASYLRSVSMGNTLIRH